MRDNTNTSFWIGGEVQRIKSKHLDFWPVATRTPAAIPRKTAIGRQGASSPVQAKRLVLPWFGARELRRMIGIPSSKIGKLHKVQPPMRLVALSVSPGGGCR